MVLDGPKSPPSRQRAERAYSLVIRLPVYCLYLKGAYKALFGGVFWAMSFVRVSFGVVLATKA